MPRIRKKTSNRVKLKDRASIQKKVKETRRKRARAAKKNPQWKSKTPKDPGIPNDFPYKDEILAEVAEQRRIAAEEKARLRAEKQRAKTGKTAEEDEEMEVDEEEAPTGKNKLDVGADAIAGLVAKNVRATMMIAEKAKVVEEAEDVEDDAPLLINRDLPTLKSVLEEADVVVEVIDARDPLETRSKFIEDHTNEQSKKLMLVLNKIDTCPREPVSAWISLLRSQNPASFPFKSAGAFLPAGPEQVEPKGKGKAKPSTRDATGTESILACLEHWAVEKGTAPLVVAVVGITNVGKSAFVNSLLKKAALPVYSQATASRSATTTELPQEVILDVNGHSIRIIDTPGLSFVYNPEPEPPRGRDILLRGRGRIDRLKDPAPPIAHLVPRCNHEDLMLAYNLAAFTKGDETAFLSGVARAHQLIKKRGLLDLAGASRIVLRDWITGKFARYAAPPSVSNTEPAVTEKTPAEWLQKLYSNDEYVVLSLTPRKDLRKLKNLVRVVSGSFDVRSVDLDAEWAALDESEDEEEEDADGDVAMGSGSDEDDEDADGDGDDDEEIDEVPSDVDEEEDEEIEEPPVSSKRKRKGGPEIAKPPAKKVVFASSKGAKAEPKPQAKTQPARKGVLKATKPAAPTPAPKKIANVRTLKTKETKAGNNDEGEAYDFGKFFK
ncbi:hypothetical protein FA15DRAFT_633591 [Coprinopsis marcescibilis]|uniref:P-loop containing nucleoside triphosphate hydrolase protein n=1 Tax=Coprinopsis marcescibilis TaxID=230819 RepID=A0A5C3L7B4_COPMA|nr:hypothetical protein FA15DRAFT_633591 [Coprinopsis marcescibilis]